MEKYLQQTKSDCIKVVLFGPESTGKSTLAKELADHFKTDFVEEYAREYLQKKYELNNSICQIDDMLPIAKGQMNLENKASIKNSIIFCDTDLLTTKVYSDIYFDHCDPLLKKYALLNHYDLYLLMNIDVPWVKDDLRDKPNERKEMFDSFMKALIENDKKFELISGNFDERKQKAITSIENLLNFTEI